MVISLTAFFYTSQVATLEMRWANMHITFKFPYQYHYIYLYYSILRHDGNVVKPVFICATKSHRKLREVNIIAELETTPSQFWKCRGKKMISFTLGNILITKLAGRVHHHTRLHAASWKSTPPYQAPCCQLEEYTTRLHAANS